MNMEEISKFVAAILYPAAIFYTVYKITPILSKAIDKFATIKIGNTTLSIGKEIERAEDKFIESKEGIELIKTSEESILIDEITSKRIENDPLGVIDDAWQALQENIVKLLELNKINTDKRRIREGISLLKIKGIITGEFAETLEIARSTFRSAMASYELDLNGDDIREYIRLTKRSSDVLISLINKK